MDTIITIIELIADIIILQPYKLLDKYIREGKQNKLFLNVISVVIVYSLVLLCLMTLHAIYFTFFK